AYRSSAVAAPAPGVHGCPLALSRGNDPAQGRTGALIALSALQGGEERNPLRSNGEGEVGLGKRSEIPHLTPALSAPRSGEGVKTAHTPAGLVTWKLCLSSMRRIHGRMVGCSASGASP